MNLPTQYRGLLHRLEDGTLAATLRDSAGMELRLTGTRCEGGYSCEVVASVPDSWVRVMKSAE